MLFNSLSFLIFLPIVVLLYYIVPNKWKHIWLLIASYYFYMCWNVKYVVLILFSTCITYSSGLLLERIKNNSSESIQEITKAKVVVAISVILNIGILIYFKYSNFLLLKVTQLFELVNIQMNIPEFDILLPIGISFYTFQALSYTIDVYRNEIHAEKNFFRYALFVSFFPQLVAGPIERSRNLLTQLAVPKKFDYESVKEGLMLMLWGFFLKIVLADRIAIFVDAVYKDYTVYNGTYIVVATMLFGIQIYCDFYGYSTIAVGSARLLGVQLMENFNAPYFSISVSEFWRKWHISLTSWFKDYLYIPLGGSRKGKLRKYMNKILVFTLSGLWHGASISFLVWGLLNGVYQVIGEILQSVRNYLVDKIQLNRDSIAHKGAKMLATWLLVNFSWIFFRAPRFKQAIEIIKNMVTVYNPWILVNESLYDCGLDQKNFHVMLMGIVVLILADIAKVKGVQLHKVILAQDYWFRCLFVSFAIGIILVFGKYGVGFDASNFIYFQF